MNIRMLIPHNSLQVALHTVYNVHVPRNRRNSAEFSSCQRRAISRLERNSSPSRSSSWKDLTEWTASPCVLSRRPLALQQWRPISTFRIGDALLRAATAAEYPRIAGYFARANARTEIPGMRGMLGYLNYALDHPQIFRYMFSIHRADAFVFPHDLKESKSPTFNILLRVVSELMERQVLRSDDVAETALSIWAHAHGLITLYLSGRIAASRTTFQELYMRSLDRLAHGLAERTANNC